MDYPPQPSRNFSFKVAGQKGQELNLAISGHIALENLSLFNSEVAALLEKMTHHISAMILDLSGN